MFFNALIWGFEGAMRIRPGQLIASFFITYIIFLFFNKSKFLQKFFSYLKFKIELNSVNRKIKNEGKKIKSKKDSDSLSNDMSSLTKRNFYPTTNMYKEYLDVVVTIICILSLFLFLVYLLD